MTLHATLTCNPNPNPTVLGSVYLRVIFNLLHTLLGSVYLRVILILFYTLLGSVYLRVFLISCIPSRVMYTWGFFLRHFPSDGMLFLLEIPFCAEYIRSGTILYIALFNESFIEKNLGIASI